MYIYRERRDEREVLCHCNEGYHRGAIGAIAVAVRVDGANARRLHGGGAVAVTALRAFRALRVLALRALTAFIQSPHSLHNLQSADSLHSRPT